MFMTCSSARMVFRNNSPNHLAPKHPASNEKKCRIDVQSQDTPESGLEL